MPTQTRQNKTLDHLTQEDGEIVTEDERENPRENSSAPKQKKSKRCRKFSSSSSSSSSESDSDSNGCFDFMLRKLNSGDRKPLRNVQRLVMSQLIPLFRNLDSEGYRCLTAAMEELESEKIEIIDIKKSLKRGQLRSYVKVLIKWIKGVQTLFSQVRIMRLYFPHSLLNFYFSIPFSLV